MFPCIKNAPQDAAIDWKILNKKNRKKNLPASRAIDGARTRGLDLGKVARYQLRHYRICYCLSQGQDICYHINEWLSNGFLEKLYFFYYFKNSKNLKKLLTK